MSKKWTMLSLSLHERFAHFARIAENWSAEDLLLTPIDWQFRERPGAHTGHRNICPGKLLPIIGWAEVAFEFLEGVAK